MGQQQLLLIILAVIIVGVGIALSISLFRQHAIDTKRDLVMSECMTLGSLAIEYYKKPTNLGGGQYSFVGWSIPSNMLVTSSGSYVATIYRDSIIFIGTGNDVVSGDDSVRVKVTVLSNAFRTEIIN